MANKPEIENVPNYPGRSFIIKKVIRDNRPDIGGGGVWHYHPEYEITLTLKSSGRRFVGYSIDDYSAIELVMLGENLPHCWLTDEYTEQYVIQFNKDTLGRTFWETPELTGINNLLNKSKHGIKFDKNTAQFSIPLILEMYQSKGFDRLFSLFYLLNNLANSENNQFLTFQDYSFKDSLKASNRIEQVYSYINRNYKNENMSVVEVSEMLCMTTSSLCKFVKKITKKTFTDLVVDRRINEACKLLRKTDKYISEICYLSGFNNISGFNRAFKKVMNSTPKEYRNIFR